MNHARYQALREGVAARRLVSSGLFAATSGDVSARTGEGDVLIAPSGLPYEAMDPGSIVPVGLDGSLPEGSLAPSSETPMHNGIYGARRDVEAVVRTHSRYATTLARPGWTIPPFHYMLTTLGPDGKVPLVPYALYGTEGLAANAAGEVGESQKACLLESHGTITVGGSTEEAFASSVILEEMAELYYHARLAGEPKLLRRDKQTRWRRRSPATVSPRMLSPRRGS